MRNIWGDKSLQPNMDEWTAHSLTPGSQGVSLPGFGAQSPHGATVTGEEAALIARARDGDQDAFGVLVRLHQRQVYNLALRMLRDPEEASEATQEAFLAAWQGLRTFREEARFSTWLYRIAYRHCLKVAESRRRNDAARAELAAEATRAQRPESVMTSTLARDAEARVREAVRAEIALLPPKYRAALILRHIQDLSYEEIADVMRAPIGTVKTLLFRARAMLKERLSDLEHARDEGLARADDLRTGWQASLEASLRGIFEHGSEHGFDHGFEHGADSTREEGRP
ncbi:MAG TPA: sigma-70 family RNA polymerase sigma factor [Ktedonobacterales bacterium]|nr:sigma-70 family RNA polymerase sigma factor [Ktedonobacterales bacterium]